MAGFDINGIELVAVTDPNEGAFTVQLPRDWQNQAHMLRPHGTPRSMVTSQSPDGAVFLFLGDPQLPAFTVPTPGMYGGFPMPNLDPMSQVHPYVPAEPFFQGQLQQRYGHMPGYRILGSTPCPDREQEAVAEAQRNGVNAYATACSLSFEYAAGTASHGLVRGRLHGLTVCYGTIWVPDVGGVLTSDGSDPADYDGLWFRISKTCRTNPQWQQLQNQGHAQKMAQIQMNHQSAMHQLQSNHQQNMGGIQQSAQSHQARMDAINAAGDAQLQGWYNQQTAGDAAHQDFMNTLHAQNTAMPGAAGGGEEDFSHRRFVNYVSEQETVVGADGATYQVETGHERYFRHKHDNTYVGADSTTERDDLQARFGVNPDDYEEVRIKR